MSISYTKTISVTEGEYLVASRGGKTVRLTFLLDNGERPNTTLEGLHHPKMVDVWVQRAGGGLESCIILVNDEIDELIYALIAARDGVTPDDS